MDGMPDAKKCTVQADVGAFDDKWLRVLCVSEVCCTAIPCSMPYPLTVGTSFQFYGAGLPFEL